MHPLAVIWPSFFVSFVMVLTIDLLLYFCGKFLTTTCSWYLKVVCHFHFLIVFFFIFFHFSKCHSISLQIYVIIANHQSQIFLSLPTFIFHFIFIAQIVFYIYILYYVCFLSYNNSSTTSCNSFSCATRPTYIVACLIFASSYLFDICIHYDYLSSCLLSYIKLCKNE
jgi:hypothetical protein